MNAKEEDVEALKEALRPPATARDPKTGLPYGFGSEEDEWAEFQAAMRG